jgi:uncharacterized protein YxjI
MGILRARRHDDPDMRRFRMQQKATPIGDDFWIKDRRGRRPRAVDRLMAVTLRVSEPAKS